MPLKGVKTYESESPLYRSTFRTTWTQPEGRVGAHIIECVVTGLNMATWTVDVVSKYDQLHFMDIQVASPYLHSNRGDGVYVCPEVGAKCYVCIPSDGPPPFVLCFIMPIEQVDRDVPAEGDEAADETSSNTFAGGRSRSKPGDIVMRGRDNNFVVLHRGGVLQIGSTELAQRLYIPLQNLVEDISQTYRHHNTGGSISWGVRQGAPDDTLPTSYKHTFRLFANQSEASVRVCAGTFDAMAEPGDGWQEDLEELEIGTDDPVVYELTVSPEGFNAAGGEPNSTAIDSTKLRFFIDKAGGVYLGSRSSVFLGFKGKIKIVAEDDIYIESKKNITIKAGGTMRIEGGDAMDISSGVTKINGGSKPVASVGSQVLFTTVAPIPIIIGAPPATTPGIISAGAVFSASVSTGNPTIQV